MRYLVGVRHENGSKNIYALGEIPRWDAIPLVIKAEVPTAKTILTLVHPAMPDLPKVEEGIAA